MKLFPSFIIRQLANAAKHPRKKHKSVFSLKRKDATNVLGERHLQILNKKFYLIRKQRKVSNSIKSTSIYEDLHQQFLFEFNKNEEKESLK